MLMGNYAGTAALLTAVDMQLHAGKKAVVADPVAGRRRLTRFRADAEAGECLAGLDLTEARPHFTAKTQIAPPCGTSGYWPGKIRFMRACIFAGSTPQPDWTAMYCLPST